MNIDSKSRNELKGYFRKNSIPTEVNFAELIDGMINPSDDGIVKLPGNPLSIAADGSVQQKIISFYLNLEDEIPVCSLSLNPKVDPENPASAAQAGFSIGDSAGNSRLFIDETTGKVGIGTISPKDLLHVAGKLRVDGAIQPSVGNSEANGIMFPKNAFGGSGDAAWIRYYNKTGESTVLEIGTSNDVNDHIVLKTNGSVGIGPQSPVGNYRLTVNQKVSSSGHGIRLLNSNSTKSCQLWVGTGGAVIDAEGTTNLHFRTAAKERIVIKNSGEIQIPASSLFFGSKTRQMINLWSTTYGIGIQSSTLYFRSHSQFCWHLKGSHTNTAGNPGAGGVKLMTLNSAGALTTKGAINAGNSDIYFTNTTHTHTANGNKKGHAAIENAKDYDALMILGRAGTTKGRKVRLWDYLQVVGTFVNSSDGRSKKDIESSHYGLKEVKKLRPVTFNWKKIANPHKSVGLIAQEVKEVIEEVVYSDKDEEGNESLSISYVNLIPVLINSIKELDDRLSVALLSGQTEKP